MNLLLQLLPYTVFTAAVLAAAGYYLVRSSNDRQLRRAIAFAEPKPVPPPAVELALPARPAAPQPAFPERTQILRLHELGITEGQIASALEMPLQEVQIAVRFEQARRARTPRTQMAQPTIVE
jgi:hypothetical protein